MVSDSLLSSSIAEKSIVIIGSVEIPSPNSIDLSFNINNCNQKLASSPMIVPLGRKILTAMRRAYPRLSTKKTANTKSSNVVSPCCSSGYEGDHLIYLRVREKKTATFRNRSPQVIILFLFNFT